MYASMFLEAYVQDQENYFFLKRGPFFSVPYGKSILIKINIFLLKRIDDVNGDYVISSHHSPQTNMA